MPASGLLPSPAVLDNAAFTSREIESEIAFVLGADLPPRPAPYSVAEVSAALARCHAGLEVLQSRFADPDGTDALSNLADLIRHGAYVVGAAGGAVAGHQFRRAARAPGDCGRGD